MNGDSARLESADTGGEVDPRSSVEACTALLRKASETLEWLGEYKAAREVFDAAARTESWWPSCTPGEGKRGGEALHGENPQDAEVIAPSGG